MGGRMGFGIIDSIGKLCALWGSLALINPGDGKVHPGPLAPC